MFHLQKNYTEKAFIFSTDVVLALLIVSAILIGANIVVYKESTSSLAKTYVLQLVDDSYTTLSRTGYITKALDDYSLEGALEQIYAKTTTLLPPNYGLRMQLTEFSLDVLNCRSQQTFQACFPDSNRITTTIGDALPNGKDVVYLKRTFLRKQPASQCEISYEFSKSNNNISSALFSFSGYPKSKILFQDNSDLNILFDVNVTPSEILECDQNARVDLAAVVPPYGRASVNIMLIQDRSGSMSWDGLLDLTNPRDLFIADNYAYVADGSAGLRIINITNALNPIITATYNSPGMASAVHVSGEYAYLADGSYGLRIVDIANKSSPTSVGFITGIGNAQEVFYLDNYAYVLTTTSGSTDFLDLESTTTQNTDLYIGRTSYSFAAQSFVPASNTIQTIALMIKKTSSTPTSDLVVRIRQSLNGPDIATATISRFSVGTSYSWYNVTFSNYITVDPSKTYFIVLTTSNISSQRYYSWAANNSNPYLNGDAYQESTPLTTTDALFRTYHRAISGLQIVDVTNVNSPIHKSSVAGSNPKDIFVSENYAYFADGSGGFKIIDVSNPLTPTQVGSVSTTDAQGIAVVSNYAYVADGSAGVRIINIENKSSPTIVSTYNTPTIAYSVFYYSDGNVYVADGSALLSINVSNPLIPLLSRSYATPYSYTKVQIANDFAFLLPGYNGSLTSFSLLTGPKIDQLKVSASAFIDNLSWTVADKIGLVSFASTATLDQTLLQLDDLNKTILKNKLNSLVANGATAIGDGLHLATAELSSSRVQQHEYKFEILLSDGQNNSGTYSPISEAYSAADKNIIVYTIGFGSDADVETLTQIANITGGKYYSATDMNVLQEIYDLISLEIGYIARGGKKQEAYNAILYIPLEEGAEVVDSGGGVLEQIADQNYLRFYIGFVDYAHPWHGSYTIQFSCRNPHSCEDSNKVFPSIGTYFKYDNNAGQPQQDIYWNVYKTVNFKYRDLTIKIKKGTIVAPNLVYLDLNVANIGYLDSGIATINFYLNDPKEGQLLKSEIVPALCAAIPANCNTFVLLKDILINSEGKIYALVNENGSVPECPHNNRDSIYCVGAPQPKYYLIEYWVWSR